MQYSTVLARQLPTDLPDTRMFSRFLISVGSHAVTFVLESEREGYSCVTSRVRVTLRRLPQGR